jgi:hypothetical protein
LEKREWFVAKTTKTPQSIWNSIIHKYSFDIEQVNSSLINTCSIMGRYCLKWTWNLHHWNPVNSYSLSVSSWFYHN